MPRPWFALLLLLTSLPGALAQDAVKPVPLDKLNTPADEVDPFPTADGLYLYYANNAPERFVLYKSARASSGQVFGAGKRLFEFAAAEERSPFVHKDRFYCALNRALEGKAAELRNFDLHFRGGEREPIPLLAVSKPADETHPCITPLGKELYFSRKTADGWKLFMANGPALVPGENEKEVGFPAGFCHATLAGAGVSMYLQGPADEGQTAIYRSRRAKVGDPWSPPELVKGLRENNASDCTPMLTADGSKLYFASNRPGGKGGYDLWWVFTSQLR